MWKWIKGRAVVVKDWFTSPNVQTWLKNSFAVLKKVLGSPEAIELYLALVGAVLGLTLPEAKVIWDIIMKFCLKAESAYPEPKSGEKKYAMAYGDFKAANLTKPNGEPVSDFEFDFVLHNILSQTKMRKAKGFPEPK